MIDDGVKSKTRKQTLITAKGYIENGKYPQVAGTLGSTTKVRIPKSTKLHDYLYGHEQKYNCRQPAWRKLEDLLNIAEQTRDEWAEKIFDEFIIRMTVFFPEKIESLKKLRQLVIWQILRGEELTDAYYESLKKLR